MVLMELHWFRQPYKMRSKNCKGRLHGKMQWRLEMEIFFMKFGGLSLIIRGYSFKKKALKCQQKKKGKNEVSQGEKLIELFSGSQNFQ